MGRKKGRPTKMAKIDVGVLLYIRKTYGNINKALLRAFPDAIEIQPEPTDTNQLKIFNDDDNGKE